MWEFGGRDRIRQQFAGQSECEAARIFYRRDLRGQDIEVGIAERDGFDEQFGGGLRRSIWRWTAGVPIGIAAIVGIFIGFDINPDVETGWSIASMAIAAPLWWVTWRRPWEAPAEALAVREPTGADRAGRTRGGRGSPIWVGGRSSAAG